MSVSRRLFLQRSVATLGAVGVAAITAKQAEAKVPKQAVGYQDTPNGSQACAHCRAFLSPHSCRIVAGNISPNGWCEMWAPKA